MTLTLPRMSRNEAQARSLIGNRARACPVFVDARWTLSLEPASLACPPPQLLDAWQIQIDWSSARFVLEIPDYACTEWLNHKMPDLEVGALPDILAGAAMEAGIADLIAPLQALNRSGRVRVTSLLRGPAKIQLPYIFYLLLASSDGCNNVRGMLHTDALGLMVVAGLVGAFEASNNTLGERDIKLPMRAQIGVTALTHAAFTALRARDIVLLDECWLSPLEDGGHALSLIMVDQTRLRVAVHDTRITVLDPWEKIVSESAEGYDLEPDFDDVPVELEAVPVRLSFDLGERLMTLRELKELQPGQSFDLGRPLEGPVRVRANGAMIGTGELVDIDGHLGVSILSIGAEQANG